MDGRIVVVHMAPQYSNDPFSLAVNSLQFPFYTLLVTTYPPSVSPEKHALPPPNKKQTNNQTKQNKTKQNKTKQKNQVL